MPPVLARPLHWALMTGISAFLFVQFFHLNGLLFASLEHVQGVNWIFLPAGLRVLLVLILDIPGAVGIMLANLWLDRQHLSLEQLPSIGVTALVSGFVPWTIHRIMLWQGLLDRQLTRLDSTRLLQFVLAYALCNALGHQLVWWLFNQHDAVLLVDIWPMFVGDAIGALLCLYGLKFTLPWLRARL